MRTLSDALLEEQKKPTRKPLVKLEVQAYGHPSQSSSMQWELFGWQRFYSGSETKDSHGVAIPSDGSLSVSGSQALTSTCHESPAPDRQATTRAGGHPSVVSPPMPRWPSPPMAQRLLLSLWTPPTCGARSLPTSGSSWGSWTQMANARPCERGVAVAFKSNGDCAIVHASDVNDPTSLYIQKRTGGTWSTGLGQRGSYDAKIEDLAMYYDGDWNIIALVLEGSYLVWSAWFTETATRWPPALWATDVKIGLGRASVDVAAQVRLRQFQTGWPVGYQPNVPGPAIRLPGSR